MSEAPNTAPFVKVLGAMQDSGVARGAIGT